MSMPAVSKHLRVLERAGLIAQRRDAQWRRCRIEAGPLKEVSDWTERYRQIWEERLDRLDKYVQQLTAKTAKEKKTHGRKQHSKQRDV
jgi:DNA-binding transcriptional ArsR family regulator